MKNAPMFSVPTMIGSLADILRITKRNYTNLISFTASDISTYLASLLGTATPFWLFDLQQIAIPSK
jgi:hypothetical protein